MSDSRHVPDEWDTRDVREAEPALDALLAAAARPCPVDPDAAEQAMTAFRTARDAGAHADARPRRRDDWRPKPQHSRARSLKAAVAALVASVTIGGVAMAAGALPDPFGGEGDDKPTPGSSRSSSAQQRPGGPETKREQTPEPDPEASQHASTGGPARGNSGEHDLADAPAPAQNAEALCRAYERAIGHGKAGDSAAWSRLEAAAGGARNVAPYCEKLLTAPTTAPAEAPDNSHRSPKPSHKGQPGS
ncbi:hypothetical protein [Streptomyces sp. H39-C1]|uniref:hypothetical protein n=1 Tax=Streptomyces sp. H39-C1 TaxID=3004355 RepID=UPI0022AFF11E|nr:hypothetical protein [Streptomyces sp. H39-C1]MCZ4103528.1 hypothetical protein [Streptomyces sp. H39-C1]